MTDLTPMKRQFRKIKEENPDSLLFFRLGDFYEMFEEDAITASKILNLTLTTRDRNKPPEEQTPMCGVPYHAARAYIGQLLERGYKVAICDQLDQKPRKNSPLMRPRGRAHTQPRHGDGRGISGRKKLKLYRLGVSCGRGRCGGVLRRFDGRVLRGGLLGRAQRGAHHKRAGQVQSEGDRGIRGRCREQAAGAVYGHAAPLP